MKRVLKYIPLMISVLALIVSSYTFREVRLTRQQYNAQPTVVERFDSGTSQFSLHPDYFVLHCRTILQIKNDGISNASLTNANVALVFNASKGSDSWVGSILNTPTESENFGATISQPLGLDVVMYAKNPRSLTTQIATGYQLFTLGVLELKQINNLIGQVIKEWNRLRSTTKNENSNSNGRKVEDRFVFERLLMDLLQANSYSESKIIPSYVNNLPFIIAEGETKPLPLDLVILIYDPTDIVPNYPSFQASYNLVFDNGFTERHTTECRNSNRMPGV